MAWSEAARLAAIEARRRNKKGLKSNPRLKAVNKLYAKIKRSSVYEDRREYDPQDLGSAYGLDRGQSRLLFRKIQSSFRRAK